MSIQTKKRIGIDCRLAGVENAGIGRYIEELVRRVIQDERFEWILFLSRKNQLDWLTPRDGVKIVIANTRHYTLREQVFMPKVFAKEELDLLHVPHFNVPLLYKGPFVTTIHDLLWHEQRGSRVTTLSPLMYTLKYGAYRLTTSKAATKAAAIIVPTKSISKTIQKLLPKVDGKKIHVTYEGVDEKWFNSATSRGQAEKILFYTGSLYPHKNVLLVAKALQQLPEYTLCISSSRSVFLKKFLKETVDLGVRERVRYLGHLSDNELRRWYGRSFALVQPSFSEGFGLTGLEAMAAELPVLASDIPVFTEIYDGACESFDPKSLESFVTSLHKLEKADKEKVVKKGIAQAKKFSWDKMVKETIDVYEGALK
ncbi:MAG TPA: glycosyltransferase family 1 protein [Patescibacteria group bacterium]|nr:glycosyltransferase family 1 protein [Patescibacteria group bacterium]